MEVYTGVWILMILHVSACPFFTIVNTTTRYNYTNATMAFNTACNSTGNVGVCDGAFLNTTDNVPFVFSTCTLNVFGVTDVNGTGAYLNTSAANGAFSANSPVFMVTGTARVTFTNLRILFSNFLFGVAQSGQLNLTAVETFFGQTAVTVAPLSTNIRPFVGIDFVVNFGLYGIVFSPISTNTLITCSHCWFQQVTKAGIAFTAGGLGQLDVKYLVFLNTLVPFGRIGQQSYGNAATTVTNIQIPQDFALNTIISNGNSYNCPQVTETVSPSPTPIFGVAVGSGTQASSNAPTCDTNCIILSFILAVLVVIALLLCVARSGDARLDKSSAQMYKEMEEVDLENSKKV